jgi:hypothetical protein
MESSVGFSGGAGTGSPQKTRQTQGLESGFRCRRNGNRSKSEYFANLIIATDDRQLLPGCARRCAGTSSRIGGPGRIRYDVPADR